MKAKLNEIIESLGYELYEQGSFTSSTEYPDHFFTYTNFETDVDRHYDNADARTVWAFWLNFYSIDPAIMQEVTDKTRKALKEKGWLVPSRGQDIDSGSHYHVGRELTIYYIEEV